jgi:uncharacterized protein YndB with AHSA1/START domain
MSEPTVRYVLKQNLVLPATPEEIFGWLTEPARLVDWWGPRGFTTPEVRLDLRVGGKYRLTMQPPDGEAFHLSGEFLTIQEPKTLSYTFRWDEPTPDDRETVVVLILSALDGVTKVSLSQGDFATDERLELHCQGWAESFEKLERALQPQES